MCVTIHVHHLVSYPLTVHWSRAGGGASYLPYSSQWWLHTPRYRNTVLVSERCLSVFPGDPGGRNTPGELGRRRRQSGEEGEYEVGKDAEGGEEKGGRGRKGLMTKTNDLTSMAITEDLTTK